MANPSRLARDQLRALARLSSLLALRPFYLAGGTAIAFHLNHRVSRDLDLFGVPGTGDLEGVQHALTAALHDVEVIAVTDATLQLRLEGIPVDIVRYPHPLLEAATPGPAGFAVAGRLDLGTMKVAAIARRGLRRDFWDLHELLTAGGLELDELLEAYLRRFGKAEPDLYHVLRSLAYFDDAERDPMPSGLRDEHWQAIRSYFEAAAPAALLRR